MSVWRDEHPDRYGPLEDGCYCVVTEPDGSHHFIHVPWGTEVYPGHFEPLYPARYACGRPHSDWRDRATRMQMPMNGVVDCPGCLEAMRRDGEKAARR